MLATIKMTEAFKIIGPTLLVTIGGLITWFLKSRKEELQAIEERALERRIEIYNKIMFPIIQLLSSSTNQTILDKATKTIKSVEYRQAAFNLITFGSDELVNSYNEMMQAFYKSEEEQNPKKLMEKLASFILHIRKDVYNKNTKLDKWDTLKFMITDIETLIK
jgi:hypothetical protein